MPFKFKILFFIFVSSLVLLFSDCTQKFNYNIIPSITFKDYQLLTYNNSVHDSALKLTVSFIDGDGDLGLTQQDTSSPYNFGSQYYYNYYAYYYEYVNGKFIQTLPLIDGKPDTNSDTVRYKGRYPDIRSESNNKALKGDIQFSITGLKPYNSDVIKFSIFIYDRALHKSNTVETPPLLFTP